MQSGWLLRRRARLSNVLHQRARVHFREAREALNKSPRRVHLRIRAACRVANPRDSIGYHCGLRLAFHPDPQRPLTARLVQSFPRTCFGDYFFIFDDILF